jgi:hypothetical protein
MIGRLGKTPQQHKEGKHNSDVEKIQHDFPHILIRLLRG